ncbi:MAG: septum formation protein Maf [Clostridia bacterium]|nr:septum formation protein Maf [Clostridia bacterium]
MIYLASASPRRRELLEKAQIPYTVLAQNADESLPDEVLPRDAVELLAQRKCLAGAEKVDFDDVVIGADTLVALGREKLGKPKDEKDAEEMLSRLSGTTHEVYTGVAIWHKGVLFSGVDETKVVFRALTPRQIKRYVATGEPMGKAGSYAIQGKGGKLVKEFRGNLDNVIGLPVSLVRELLDKHEKRDLMAKAAEALTALYPDATCALEYGGSPWRLLVMGRLSAQCTDARVNVVCKDLFAKFPTPEAMAQADIREIEALVRPCGLYHTKAESIKEASRLLVEEFGGVLPRTMDELLRFPGVGRKIANLLLGDIYHLPAVVTDTHCIRICGRLGAYDEAEKNPFKVEKILGELLPPEESADFCHRIVHFGREICKARGEKCKECVMREFCRHYAKKK